MEFWNKTEISFVYLTKILFLYVCFHFLLKTYKGKLKMFSFMCRIYYQKILFVNLNNLQKEGQNYVFYT